MNNLLHDRQQIQVSLTKRVRVPWIGVRVKRAPPTKRLRPSKWTQGIYRGTKTRAGLAALEQERAKRVSLEEELEKVKQTLALSLKESEVIDNSPYILLKCWLK